MTLNGHFALNSVLRRYVWSSEAYGFRSYWLGLLWFVSVVFALVMCIGFSSLYLWLTLVHLLEIAVKLVCVLL